MEDPKVYTLVDDASCSHCNRSGLMLNDLGVCATCYSTWVRKPDSYPRPGGGSILTFGAFILFVLMSVTIVAVSLFGYLGVVWTLRTFGAQ